MREWWAYWVSSAAGGESQFIGWMYLASADAGATQEYLRMGMLAGLGGMMDPTTAYLVNAITGQPAPALIMI